MKKTVTEALSAQSCTGCGVCSNLCPVKAISMQPNQEGFLYPVIEEKHCTHCSFCEAGCPVLHRDSENEKEPDCLAVWAKDEVRRKSSSGGVFYVLAEYVLERQGIVCGAAYNDQLLVEHIAVDNFEDLEKLRGSKYLQSDPKDIYTTAKKALDAGRLVLFSGCPCQVAGLYQFLEGDRPNLITADLICHGVPSPKVYQKYLKETYPNREIEKIDFRDKTVYGWSTEMNIQFKDGEIVRNTHDKDPYYRAFLPCLSLRKSCSICKFSKLPRVGDFTLGDFWGISHYNPSFNDRKGTSLILLNNTKAKELFQNLHDKFSLSEKVPMEYGTRVNKTLIHPFRAHPARRRFFENLEKTPLNKLVDDCLHHKYDIGIVDLWYGLNYGSILTAYALYKVVESHGYSALMLHKPKAMWTPRYENRETIAGKFIHKHCYVSNVRENYDDWKQLNNHCDTFIVGSDVVWNYKICGGFGHFFFLDFVQDDKKKIAFASSFGAGYEAPEKDEILTAHYLQKFDHIAVREKEAVEICKNRFHVKADLVLDPVFLCKESVYEEAIAQATAREESPFIMSYVLGPDAQKRKLLLSISKKLGLPLRNVVNPNNIERGKAMLKLPALDNPSVEDWLYYIKNCSYFVGDSFHGMCFSLIFQKPFFIIRARGLPDNCRFTSLLSQLGLMDRLIYTDEVTKKLSDSNSILEKPIDYERVNRILNKEKEKSEAWLLHSIRAPKTSKITAEEILYQETENRISRLEKKIEKVLQFFQKSKNESHKGK